MSYDSIASCKKHTAAGYWGHCTIFDGQSYCVCPCTQRWIWSMSYYHFVGLEDRYVEDGSPQPVQSLLRTDKNESPDT